MIQTNGIFTISLDFELYWGVRDKRKLSTYSENLLNIRRIVQELLDVFDEYNVHTTWGIVGFLFFSNFGKLKQNIPDKLPNYTNTNLSPYSYINGLDKVEDRYHFAPDLIHLICQYDNQEIGTHTFSHYYCLEDGQSIDEFRADICSAINIANKKGIKIKSLIFPRNQLNKDYLKVLRELGIKCYRGNEKSWMFSTINEKGIRHMLRRALRLIDAYLNISGYNCYTLDEIWRSSEILFSIPSSRFLRPVSKKLVFFERLRIGRIKNAMTYAAKNKKIFHLWWHPHNFGVNTRQNMLFLRGVLDHFKELRYKYGMYSLNMGELIEIIDH